MGNIIFFSDFLRDKFGFRVHKVSFRLNNTCPNRDGTISRGGCVFCNGKELIPKTYRKGMTPIEQIKAGIEIVRGKYKAEGFIAYLQDNTGTYGDEEYIIGSLIDVLSVNGIVGLSIGTRADCISENFFKFFEEISKKTFLMVEIGVQSINEETLRLINRGHNVDIMERMFDRLAESGIHTVAHIILGLMNDSESDIINLADWLYRHKVSGVKIHNIVVLRDTQLEKMYYNNRFIPPDKERLLELYKLFFENIKGDLVIHRLTTDADKRYIVAPDYAFDKNSLINEIKRLLNKV